jgi:putative ATP-binding cassette transporter
MQANSPHQTSNGTLLFGAVSSIVSVISFTSILWHLSGDLAVFGLVIPKAMFWSLFIYVAISTVIATRLGRPLIKLTFDNEKHNAAFRHSLSRLHDSADTVAFDRGEEFERLQLRQHFQAIVDNYRRFVRRTMGLVGWNLSVNHVIIPVPWLMQAPRLFAGQIKFGDVTQSVMVFSSIQDSLSWFRNSYDQFAGYRSSIIRLYELVIAGEQARQLPQLSVEASASGIVELDAVDVRNPAGGQLISGLDLRLEPGDTLIVTGKSGAGKTTLLRSLAQLWPFAGGTLRCPAEVGEVMFMSRLPYLPLGDLRTVLSYPRQPGEITDDALRAALLAVALPDCVERLGDVAEWHRELSPGEQQRIAFARLLLAKPKAVFLDEATSALDEALEFMILSEAQRELPDTVFVSITHRNAVDPHHKKHLELLGGGAWRLGPAGSDSQPVGSSPGL